MAGHHLHVVLGQGCAVPRAARGHVGALFDAHGLNGDAKQVALLITSELVSNAIRYGAAPIELHAEVTDHIVRVEVSDRGAPLRSNVRYADPCSTRGRGLAIIDALSRDWGVECHGDAGKTVWAELNFDDSRAAVRHQ